MTLTPYLNIKQYRNEKEGSFHAYKNFNDSLKIFLKKVVLGVIDLKESIPSTVYYLKSSLVE